MGRSRSIPEDFCCPKPTGRTSQPSLSQLFPTTWEQEAYQEIEEADQEIGEAGQEIGEAGQEIDEADQEMEEADQEMEEADQLKEAKQEK